MKKKKGVKTDLYGAGANGHRPDVGARLEGGVAALASPEAVRTVHLWRPIHSFHSYARLGMWPASTTTTLIN